MSSKPKPITWRKVAADGAPPELHLAITRRLGVSILPGNGLRDAIWFVEAIPGVGPAPGSVIVAASGTAPTLAAAKRDGLKAAKAYKAPKLVEGLHYYGATVRCNRCKVSIRSRYRHDFKSCKCGDTSVDGGFDYLRLAGSDYTVLDQGCYRS